MQAMLAISNERLKSWVISGEERLDFSWPKVFLKIARFLHPFRQSLFVVLPVVELRTGYRKPESQGNTQAISHPSYFLFLEDLGILLPCKSFWGQMFQCRCRVHPKKAIPPCMLFTNRCSRFHVSIQNLF